MTHRWSALALVAMATLWPALQAVDAATPKSGQASETSVTGVGRSGGVYAGVVTSPWGCYTAWSGCARPANWRMLLERQARFDDLRRDSSAAAQPLATNPWYGWSGAPLPPPTPEKQIQPAYRDRSVLRPEYREDSQEAK